MSDRFRVKHEVAIASTQKNSRSLAALNIVRASSTIVRFRLSTMMFYSAIMEYLVKISKRHAFWSLNEDFEDYCSDIQYAVSIKEDTAYLYLHFTKDHKGTRSNTSYLEKTNTPYSSYGNKIFWKISNVCMTRSSTKELFTPFKEPEREFRSSRNLFKTLSLDKSRSPEFNLFSNLEEYSEEEVAETMAETMEQYMSKTRADYGSGIARPKIDDKDSFELKG
ncbi:hypothetical protein Tco_1400560 [Tanacetum coccineum]